MAQHSTLTGSELHEPKGADAAAANKVYVSDGGGSGAWSDVPPGTIDGSGATNTTDHLRADGTYVPVPVRIQARIPDISVADIIYVPCPVAGTITKVITILESAIVTDNGDVRLRIGGTNVTNSDVTITASGSAAGDADTATPTAANTVTADSAIEVQTTGAASTAAVVEVMIEVTET